MVDSFEDCISPIDNKYKSSFEWFISQHHVPFMSIRSDYLTMYEKFLKKVYDIYLEKNHLCFCYKEGCLYSYQTKIDFLMDLSTVMTNRIYDCGGIIIDKEKVRNFKILQLLSDNN